MTTLALDVGGANVKLATSDGLATSIPFALWREPERLDTVLRHAMAPFEDARRLAVTMTGELCDCFRDRADGVRSILRSVESATRGDALTPCVWTLDRRLLTIAAACKLPERVAAANWMALAEWVARENAGHRGVLIDCGSTTTDLVPFADGTATPRAEEDTTRLAAGELVYSGVRRTPLCAVLRSARYRQLGPVPLAAELFATTLDVWLTLDEIEDDPLDHDTADGQPATRRAARARLARSICADPATFTDHDARSIARDAAEAQLGQIVSAARASSDAPKDITRVVLSGSGEFAARRAARSAFPGVPVLSLADRHGATVSSAACAWALASLVEHDREDVGRAHEPD